MTEGAKKTSHEKLSALRAALGKQGVDGLIVPHADEFQNEYTPPSAERLAWLTEFTGSAGVAVVLADKAVVMSDGRYTLQLEQQVDARAFATQDETDISAWLIKNAKAGAKIGYDPKLHTAAELRQWTKDLKAKKIELVPLNGNPLDALWEDRPAAPASAVEIFPDSIAGRNNTEKREEIAQAVKNAGGHAVVIAQPASIAWMLNIRGSDVPMTPVALAYALVRDNGDTDLFIDAARVSSAVRAHLGNHVTVRAPSELEQALTDLARDAAAAGKPVLVDPERTSLWFKKTIETSGGATEDFRDPCLLPRALKTPEEKKAITETHVRDGVAMARFLKWLDETASGGNLTEIDVSDKLRTFRDIDPAMRDDSFNTICGWAGNGAIVHYRATAETNKTITPPGILLVDSGAQYAEGTTDITRTVTIGAPQEEAKKNFTLVLKGHIAVATSRFPENTSGSVIDGRARSALWEAGLDYDHGTGHGVGCYLGVHEPCERIAKNSPRVPSPTELPLFLRAGMFISNEPGFYKAGEYGIRIESLVFVKEDGIRQGTNGKVKMLAFETVTLAPIDRRLIVPEMMDDKELQWLNDYHERVYQTLAPRLEADVAAWLRDATMPIKKNDPSPHLGNKIKPPPPGPFC